MAIVLVGSFAAGFRIPKFRNSGFDLDIFCTAPEFEEFARNVLGDNLDWIKMDEKPGKAFARSKSGFMLEAEIAEDGNTVNAMVAFVLSDKDTEVFEFSGSKVYLPSLNFLYMLKMSHRYRKNSPHFYKTRGDILKMREFGAKIGKGALKELYKRRMADTYTYAHPNLKQSKADFFSDTVPYKYDHDSIHRAVVSDGIPAYTLVKEAQDEVHMKKENFFSAPLDVQLRCTLEESYVLSLERSIIPFEITDPEKQRKAFEFALMKVCTSITSGWFRQFSWENMDVVRSMYDPEYISRFNAALARGEILPFSGSQY